MTSKRIFTFWEPRQNIPGYIQMCMKTWTKHLSDYEIVVLDYNNLYDWLSKKTINKILEKKMDLAMQSDCIRCAILREYGGIWIDADTVITSSDVFEIISKTQCHMIGRKSDKVLYGAFIYTAKPHTGFMDAWFKSLVKHVRQYRFCTRFRKFKFLFKGLYDKTRNWDWAVNAIIDAQINDFSAPEFDYTDKDVIGALPELMTPAAQNISSPSDKIKLYQNFYFSDGPADKAIEHNRGIILLHNSWTPLEYKRMSADDFMSTNTVLANTIKYAMGEK